MFSPPKSTKLLDRWNALIRPQRIPSPRPVSAGDNRMTEAPTPG